MSVLQYGELCGTEVVDGPTFADVVDQNEN